MNAIAACKLCPRACGVRRELESGAGVCGMGALPHVARAALHFGEEPCISGTRGSGTVFFSGCSLRCVFCQNSAISQEKQGQPLTVQALGEAFLRLRDAGAHNINLVNPTHFAHAIREALLLYPPGIPVVYNSSGYEAVDTLAMLDGLIDVYLPDLKYLNTGDAAFLSGARDYPEHACAAIQIMRAQTGPAVYDSEGMMLRGTLVRHLVLPGMTAESMRVLNWLHENLPDTPVSLMGQYTPYHKARAMKGLDKPLSADAYARVAAHARAIGTEGYVQPPEAAGEGAIPAWDNTGITP